MKNGTSLLAPRFRNTFCGCLFAFSFLVTGWRYDMASTNAIWVQQQHDTNWLAKYGTGLFSTRSYAASDYVRFLVDPSTGKNYWDSNANLTHFPFSGTSAIVSPFHATVYRTNFAWLGSVSHALGSSTPLGSTNDGGKLLTFATFYLMPPVQSFVTGNLYVYTTTNVAFNIFTHSFETNITGHTNYPSFYYTGTNTIPVPGVGAVVQGFNRVNYVWPNETNNHTLPSWPYEYYFSLENTNRIYITTNFALYVQQNCVPPLTNNPPPRVIYPNFWDLVPHFEDRFYPSRLRVYDSPPIAFDSGMVNTETNGFIGSFITSFDLVGGVVTTSISNGTAGGAFRVESSAVMKSWATNYTGNFDSAGGATATFSATGYVTIFTNIYPAAYLLIDITGTNTAFFPSSTNVESIESMLIRVVEP